MPVEVIRRWTRRTGRLDVRSGTVVHTLDEMATARCLGGHWYGGPAADLEEHDGLPGVRSAG
jgi:hypothetical protein